jgi:hypothetical protein
MAQTIQVTSEGVLIPRSLIETWGDIQEVEVEQYPGAIVIKPIDSHSRQSYDQIVSQMKASGLVEDLPWPQPPPVSPEERATLAEKLSRGKPLSQIILEDREDRV